MHALLVLLTALAIAAPSAGAAPGTVAGTIRLSGPAPARPPLPVYKHQEVCGRGVPDDRLVVGPGGGLRYAVVTIEGVRGGRKPDRSAVPVLNNLACRFEPHVQVAEVGQALDLRNGDPILHNADARMGGATVFNVALTPGRQVRRPLERAGTLAVTCDVRHTWMSAFVVVAEHPYHTVTDVEGAFEIRDVPPGSYTLRVWHEELGPQTQPIKVEAARTTTVEVAYPGSEARAAR